MSGYADPHATQTQPIAIGERGGPRDRGLSWHGGAAVREALPGGAGGSRGDKWILQVFKEVPRAMRGTGRAKFIAAARGAVLAGTDAQQTP